MSLQKAAEKILRDIIVLKSNESLLIVTDKNKKEIAEVFFEEGKKITENIKIIKTPITEIDGQEPPAEVAEEMLKHDIELLITKKSLTHTKAAINAAKNKARVVASMPDITADILIRFSKADINLMQSLGNKLRNLIEDTDWIRIKTDKGTDLRFSVTSDRFLFDYSSIIGKKGEVGNIPLGEVCCRIPDSNANGKFVIDLSVIGGIVDKPIEVIVKDNYAVDIKGGKTAEKLKATLEKYGKKAFFVAELGIGTNNTAKITGNVLEDEKVLGTCHIALGNDTGFRGGKNYVPIHLDCVIDKPTIYFDDKKIMEKGQFLIK